jgi:hypothetical protein
MRTVGHGLLSGQAVDVRETVRGLLVASGTRVVVTVKNTDSDSYDPASGAYTVTSTDNTLDAWVSTLSQREAGAVPDYQVGDLRVCVMLDEQTILPTKDSTLTFSTHDHRVIAIETDPLNVYTEFIVRRRT